MGRRASCTYRWPSLATGTASSCLSTLRNFSPGDSPTASHPLHAEVVGLASWAAVAHCTRGVHDLARSGTMEYVEKVRSQFLSLRHKILF
jgi:hypothetical protein